MIQHLPGTFRRDSSGTNVSDSTGSLNTAFQSAHSLGATIIDTASLSTGAYTRMPTCLSLSISAYIGWIPTGSIFGKFGRIIGGLIPTGSVPPTHGNGTTPWVFGQLPLPTDPTLTAPLWEPGTSELPPVLDSNTGFQPQYKDLISVSAAIIPSQPVPIEQQAAIGIWITPMLMGTPNPNGGLTAPSVSIYYATYTLVYDDGS